MKSYNFNKEELGYLKDTLRLVLEDINEIYETSELEIISIDFLTHSEQERWKLITSDYKLTLKRDEQFLAEFARIKPTKKSKGHYEYNYQWTNFGYNVILRFLASYKDIRKTLLETAQNGLNSKETLMDELRKLRTNFTKEVYVDFGTNNTQNQHALEVTEQDGKQIGTINFGQKTVKIISEGEIVLTHTKRAEEKVKSLN